GCSSRTESSSDDGGREIRFFRRFAARPDQAYLDGVAQRFEEEHGGVTVTVSSAISDDYTRKSNELMGNDDPPDVFFTWAGEYSNKFARSGQALDLTEYAREGSTLQEQVISTQLDPYTFEDKLYGVPIIMDGKAFFYNKEIFDELNLEEPSNWEEFIKVLDVISQTDYTALSFGNQEN